jgi:hypothetical protein
MSNPFSGIPGPETPRPTRRRFQPGLVQEAFQAMRETLRPALPAAERALQKTRWATRDAVRRAQRLGEELSRRVKRNPRPFGLVAGAVALTLVGALALSASGARRSLCPPTSQGKTPQFRLLMDPLPQVAAGSKVEIKYDVCGLSSGAAYRGRVRLVQQKPTGKKKSAKPKLLVVSFKDQVDGVATRRQQELNLGSTKPGAYTLELTVADSKGRERKRVQKVVIKAQ